MTEDPRTTPHTDLAPGPVRTDGARKAAQTMDLRGAGDWLKAEVEVRLPRGVLLGLGAVALILLVIALD